MNNKIKNLWKKVKRWQPLNIFLINFHHYLSRMCNWINRSYIGVIILIIFIPFLTLFFQMWGPISQPGFDLYIEPLCGDVIPGNISNCTVLITKTGGIPYIWEYNNEVSLFCVDVPSNVTTTIMPYFGKPIPQFSTTIKISISPNISPGDYYVSLMGVGADGFENSAYYIFRVSDKDDNLFNQPWEEKLFNTQKGEDIEISKRFYPSGWMGDYNKSIKYDPASFDIIPKTGYSSIKIQYDPSQENTSGWAGIYWQYPENNWGFRSSGYDLNGYNKLSFWVCGKNGTENVEFKIGGVGINDKHPYPDSMPQKGDKYILSKEWKKYTIDISKENLSHIIGGFMWAAHQSDNPNGCTIYLNDILLSP